MRNIFNSKSPPKGRACADSCRNFWTTNLKTPVPNWLLLSFSEGRGGEGVGGEGREGGGMRLGGMGGVDSMCCMSNKALVWGLEAPYNTLAAFDPTLCTLLLIVHALIS